MEFLAGVNGSQVASQIWSVIFILSFLGIFFFLIVGLIVNKAFNLRCLILEQTGGGIRAYFRRAKRLEKPDGGYLQFLFSSMKERLPLPANNYLFLYSEKNFVLTYYKDKNGNYKPCSLAFSQDNNPLLMVDDTLQRAWYARHVEETNKVYDTEALWAKYGPTIVLGATMAFALLVLIIYGKFYFDGINGAAGSLGGKLDKLTDVISSATGIGR